jgi:polyisoprenoid-binding protein YceI
MVGNPGPRIHRSGAAIGALALAFTMALPATSAAEVLRLEPSSTKVGFSLGSTLHEVEGIFELTGGEIEFDTATGAASGRVVVSALSGDTANKRRDKKMHNKVLESATFPEIVFVPHHLDGTLHPQGESEVRLQGTIQIHGARHDIDIPAVVRMEQGRLTGTAEFSIPFVAWGMEDPSVFLFRVKKEVHVALDLNGVVLSGPAVVRTSAGSKP